ncbi:acyl-CoA thioesterase [Parendozoicomonas haliclonae]|uniref:Putative acyl-CoA thioester hydrolase n=1 Tax=Parendozoicomonas haliclonae TaxID=1960125 RepID=A0A1X7AJK8_9GAMM|nr:acyl-CoA thioesterase [Parendozoicomonas haliclonae]SMA45900.1 putative acyl-CoA thioester hydrolase [Parendozoicomonas haliclonae]
MEVLEYEATTDAESDALPAPQGELTLQIPAMPRDTNPDNDIFGGWVVSQMDLAAEITARRVAKGRVTTISIHQLNFLRPIEVGDMVSCYTNVTNIGGSSIHIDVEVWVQPPAEQVPHKVTDGTFVFVAIDANRRTRRIR